MVFRTWDLNFGAWIFTLAVSKTETWKLLGRDFQDVGFQFWDLDFTQGLINGLRPRAPTNVHEVKANEFQNLLDIASYSTMHSTHCWLKILKSTLVV
jgi:hypothetical protein